MVHKRAQGSTNEMPERPRSKSAGTRSAVGLNYQKGLHQWRTRAEAGGRRSSSATNSEPELAAPEAGCRPIGLSNRNRPMRSAGGRQIGRIKSDQPIRESRVFRAQTARQLANQRKQGLSRPNCEAAGSDYKKAPPRRLRRLHQIQSDSAGHLRAVQGCNFLKVVVGAGLYGRRSQGRQSSYCEQKKLLYNGFRLHSRQEGAFSCCNCRRIRLSGIK